MLFKYLLNWLSKQTKNTPEVPFGFFFSSVLWKKYFHIREFQLLCTNPVLGIEIPLKNAFLKYFRQDQLIQQCFLDPFKRAVQKGIIDKKIK